MIYLFEGSHDFWASRDIRVAVREAFEASRRIEKDLDVARETTRLAVALRTIEGAICAAAIPKLVDGAEAKALIAGLPHVGSVRLPFKLLEKAGQVQAGSFLSIVPFTGLATSIQTAEVSRSASPKNSEPVSETHHAALDTKSKLQSRIAGVRDGKKAVPLGNSRHIEITEALRTFLHASEGKTAFNVNFIYKDGSIGGDVHLSKLPMRSQPSKVVELNAALESCRHFDLDSQIDFCVLRNAEIEKRGDASLADQEAIAYARVQACLDELCGTDGLHLRLFHTGLEPAVIGVYRAVIDALVSGARLQVTPVFFPAGKDEQSWW